MDSVLIFGANLGEGEGKLKKVLYAEHFNFCTSTNIIII